MGRPPRRPDHRNQVGLPSFGGLAGGQGRILDDGEHRALDRFANGGVGPLPCAFQPGGEGLASRDLLSASTSHAPRIICEYDPGVSPRAHQRGPGTGPARLLGATVGLARSLVQRGTQGE